MRKRLFTVLTVVLSALLFLTVGSLTATDVPDTITMDSKIYPKHTKKNVTFTHKEHADHKDIGCADCHHVYKDGKNTWKEGDVVQKCEECHNEPAKPKGDKTKMSKAEKIKKYCKDAVHANCKGCHKKMIDKESEMGKSLKKCSGCHPNKKK
jgi:hypothetical protein